DVELSVLQKRWQQSRDGEGQAVLIQGDAGVGKSRLVRAFGERLASLDYQSITLSCSPHHQASAFYPVIEQLHRVLEAAGSGGDRAGRRASLEGFVANLGLLPGDVAPPLVALLGTAEDATEDRAPVHPDALRRATLDAVVRVVLRMAQQTPLLVVTEDAHWIDPSTEELLGHLLDGVRDRTAMVLITARPDYRAPWVGMANFSTLSLGRLSRRETEA